MDAQTAAAIANATNQIANNAATIGVNTKNRKWAKKMYELQRQHSIEDWQMQNAYNTPAAQMQRLKEAGLNPHLVYGNGADAQAGSIQNRPQMEYVAQEAPQFNADATLNSYYNTQVRQAQIDNMRVQKTVMEQEAVLKSVQALQSLATTGKTKEETTNIQLLRESTIEAAKKNVEKISADIESTRANTIYTLSENMRKAELQPITIKTMNEQIKNMIEQRKLSAQQREEIINRINIMAKDGSLKDWELEQRNKGIAPGDPAWLREWKNLIDKINNWSGGMFNKRSERSKSNPKSLTEWADKWSPY